MSEPRAIDVPLHLDARGWLMATDKAFEGMNVAYAYPTCCFPGVVKGWHRHAVHADRMMCVSGAARVVVARVEWKKSKFFVETSPNHLYLDIDAGILQEFVIGPLSPKIVVIPPGWWHGFQALGDKECIIINAPDMPYDPSDEERLAIGAIPFEWRSVDG